MCDSCIQMMNFRSFVLSFVLNQLCLSTKSSTHKSTTAWNRVMENSLSLCLSNRQDHSQRFNPDVLLRSNFKCFNDAWFKCRYLQNQVIVKSYARVSHTNYWPCYRSRFLWKSSGQIVYEIHGHKAFQFNLTFTEFNLKRSDGGCLYHDITVRWKQ